MYYLLLTIYLLIGFQFGARVFFWARNIGKDPKDFILPLILVPIFWPLELISAIFHDTQRKCYFHWED
jgi:hypothetical protein